MKSFEQKVHSLKRSPFWKAKIKIAFDALDTKPGYLPSEQKTDGISKCFTITIQITTRKQRN